DFDTVLRAAAVAHTSYQSKRASARDCGFNAWRKGLFAMGSRDPGDPRLVVFSIVAGRRGSRRFVFPGRARGRSGRAVPCGNLADFSRAPHATTHVIFTEAGNQ